MILRNFRNLPRYDKIRLTLLLVIPIIHFNQSHALATFKSGHLVSRKINFEWQASFVAICHKKSKQGARRLLIMYLYAYVVRTGCKKAENHVFMHTHGPNRVWKGSQVEKWGKKTSQIVANWWQLLSVVQPYRCCSFCL